MQCRLRWMMDTMVSSARAGNGKSLAWWKIVRTRNLKTTLKSLNNGYCVSSSWLRGTSHQYQYGPVTRQCPIYCSDEERVSTIGSIAFDRWWHYYPSSSWTSEETLDSFIYEASSKTATIFQATVLKKHSVKQGGIEWLQGLGVETFRFIVVTAPEMPLDSSFPFSNQWRTELPSPSIPDK